MGAFAQLQYKKDDFSAFFQGAFSNQGFKRVEYFNQVGTATTDWKNITGGNIKAGFNYNFDIKNNFYANAGYYSKQPNFDAVYKYISGEVMKCELGEDKILEGYRPVSYTHLTLPTKRIV